MHNILFTNLKIKKIKKDFSKSRNATNYANRCGDVHTAKPFRSLVKSSRNQILFTIFRLVLNETDICLVPDQSENGKYNLISVRFNKISKIILCV